MSEEEKPDLKNAKKSIEFVIKKVTIIWETETRGRGALSDKTCGRAKTEPTDKSNSPEIMRTATPTTMIPSSGTISSMVLILSRLRNKGERI